MLNNIQVVWNGHARQSKKRQKKNHGKALFGMVKNKTVWMRDLDWSWYFCIHFMIIVIRCVLSLSGSIVCRHHVGPASHSVICRNCLALDNSQTSHSHLFVWCSPFIRNDGINLSQTYFPYNVSYCHSGHCVLQMLFFSLSSICLEGNFKNLIQKKNSLSHGYNGYTSASVHIYFTNCPNWYLLISMRKMEEPNCWMHFELRSEGGKCAKSCEIRCNQKRSTGSETKWNIEFTPRVAIISYVYLSIIHLSRRKTKQK